MTFAEMFVWFFMLSIIALGVWGSYWFWSLVVGPVPGTRAWDLLNDYTEEDDLDLDWKIGGTD